jgi:hypothetical protein
MSIEIREHAPGGDIGDFLRAGEVVFRDDPQWVPPLKIDIEKRLNPKKNPFFERGEAMLFTAWRDGQLVGRVSASIDREHLKLWKDERGFFGFFDTIDDDAVGAALLDRAAAWLKGKGVKTISGPFSIYANEEIGLLVEGFDSPPALSMAHSRPWQDRIATAWGLAKEKDLWAWRYDVTALPARVERAWKGVKELPEVKLRSIDTSRMREELQLVMDIYNDAWQGKWIFVPMLANEIKAVAEDLELIIDPDLAFIAEVDGKAMGMCILLPNVNEILHELRGSHWIVTMLKLVWRLKVQKRPPRSARLMLLGIRGELRNVRKYMGLSAAMYAEVATRGKAKGYTWGELSWTREDDSPINAGIANMGAKVYKKYRIYQKAL